MKVGDQVKVIYPEATAAEKKRLTDAGYVPGIRENPPSDKGKIIAEREPDARGKCFLVNVYKREQPNRPRPQWLYADYLVVDK